MARKPNVPALSTMKCEAEFCRHALAEHGPKGCLGVITVHGNVFDCICKQFRVPKPYEPPGTKPQWEPEDSRPGGTE